jgi:hypothetical protein
MDRDPPSIRAEQSTAADAFQARLSASVRLSRKNYGKHAKRVVKIPEGMGT